MVVYILDTTTLTHLQRGHPRVVAAVALEVGATVVTNNLRDFGRLPGLVVEDWTV